MYCSKCGKDNPDDSLYCNRCGNLLEPEDETRVASRSGDGVTRAPEVMPERIFTIAPTLKFVYFGYAITALAAFAVVALLAVFVAGLAPWIGVIVGLLLLLIPAYFHLKQKMVRYTLTDTTIEIDRGLLSRTTQNIPLRRVQDVTVSATVFQRLLGYGDITIDNASELGGKVVLDNVDSPKANAELILRQMRHIEK